MSIFWHKNTEVQLKSGRIQYLQRTQLLFKKRMQVKSFSLSRNDRINKTDWFNVRPPPTVNPDAVRVFHILKWWTWRRRLSGAGFLPCCSCEDQSKPGWPPPLLTSGLKPFCDPWNMWHSSEYNRKQTLLGCDTKQFYQDGTFSGASRVTSSCRAMFRGVLVTYRVYVLEKLERFHSASRVGKEQPQVILRHILSTIMKDKVYS